MPFNRPSPEDILQRIRSEIDILLPGSDARLRRSPENVLAGILAMSSHELHSYLEWISRQILPDTADEEILERHASIWGITRNAATGATGIIEFTGTNGAVIPASSVVRRSDDIEYEIDADITIAGGVGSGSITALSQSALTNAEIGVKLSLISPVAGVQSEGSVIDDGNGNGLTGGVDVEADVSLRTRVIERIQQPPHGGADFDYVSWSKEVSGVTRAWVYPMQSGLGTVDVTFVMDNKAGSIIPSAAEVQTVQDYIDGRRPVTADVTVFAPAAVPVDFDISINPNTVAVQQAIEASLNDFFKREAQPGQPLYISRIREAISAAAGEFDHVLNSPNANVTENYGDLATLGNFTWSAL